MNLKSNYGSFLVHTTIIYAALVSGWNRTSEIFGFHVDLLENIKTAKLSEEKRFSRLKTDYNVSIDY